jgi:two-component system OmpR family response regulator
MISHQESAQVRPAPAASQAARRILIVDDEPEIRSFIGCALAAAGYLPDFAVNGTQALAQLRECRYDLIILDLVMPDMDGACALEWMLSTHPDQAVIVVSCINDVATKLDCLERGAHDYLTKPFSLAELLARVRVQLRDDALSPGHAASSGEDAGGAGGVGAPEVVSGYGLTLDAARLVADIGHGPVPLTRLEFMLLRELATRAGQPVPKAELLATVWGCEFDPGSNRVDVCVRRLRSKLGFDLIETVRGQGYQLADLLPTR